MKQLHFIQAAPSDLYFLWQTEVQLHNFRKYGYSSLYRALIFIPADRAPQGVPQMWRDLEAKYPEAKFYYYFDDGSCLKDINRANYIPLLRLFCLKNHFTEHPYLKDDAIFYHDADILFCREIDFTPYLEDDNTCYLSNTDSYLNKEYFESKMSWVAPNKMEAYKQMDLLGDLGRFSGITSKMIEENNSGVGGAQYLLKGIDAAFWEKCYTASINIRIYLQMANQFFIDGNNPAEKENNGWQSWTADMIAVLHGLWAAGLKTVTPKELDFAWATDPISRLETVSIFHNAGASGTSMELNGKQENIFYKSKHEYVNNLKVPQQEPEYLESVSKEYCTSFYTQELLSIKTQYNYETQSKT